MPLSAGVLTTTPDLPVEPPGVPSAPPEIAAAEWVAPDGSGWTLTNWNPATTPGWHTLTDIIGWGAAPVSLTTDKAARGGVRVRHRRADERIITWPLHVWANTQTLFWPRRRQITQAFTQTTQLGPGVLRVFRPDGTAREITCWYMDGAQGNAGEDDTHATLAIQLLCEDPYFRDVTPTSDFRAHGSGASFLDPFLTISSAQALGATEIVNDGSVHAWPTWTLTGPMTAATFTNGTTGEAFTVTYTLLAGETITITTEPPTVRGPAGQVLTSALNWPGAVLWGLRPGVNAIEFAATGAAAGTEIRWSYYRRYETA